ncbi:hypothetical protein NYZ99_08315 [Maribacter litopenaei]|uniref:Beta-glucosidase n=1 Tax=Maribacter litopenaei TaxID=2976127 RepID=A0ABY5YB00_9FLAO|nr:hypothetical protein [Maribacter litopenaei]UWX56227.1 hypothetical protein NYZ99_08315 [Maribacter litopenaei]
MKIYFPLLFLGILAASCKEKKATKIESTTNEESLHVAVDSISKNFRIEILDEEALSLLNKDATIKVLASGFKWIRRSSMDRKWQFSVVF